ncbi:MAG: alginate lyase family protein, partial [Phycisphaerae bacterium]|nr:alginate lyase family protein [Phycisphaerae bacterium]
LWVYNLHYFGDLVAVGANERAEWQRALMLRWVQENPPATGTGWEPYPASLRIVNWIKWALAGNELPAPCLHSVAVQVRWVAKRLEWHLLGNHLFVNAKALVMAGLFFDGPEAERWLRTGERILREQIPEQVLADGGQFERSPMYHALALEDMLDLSNALRAFRDALPGDLRSLSERLERQVNERVQPMRHWLAVMSHPDGEISFFNDAAIGIAPSNQQLDSYARRLGFADQAPIADGLVHLKQSGYIRLQRGPAVAMLDVAPVGPDYLPGHAHADTLSFELSLHGARVVVNSGTSVYGSGAERLRQRGTAAHSTVVVNDADSSEVWGGFRVARRARPHSLTVVARLDGASVACSHDGYRRLPGSPDHRREWQLHDGVLTVTDGVRGARSARARWHFAPGVVVAPQPSATPSSFVCTLPCGRSATLAIHGAACRIQPSTFHPQFGLSLPATLLDCTFTGAACSARISWS